jgi:hypothetical protein
MSRPKTNSSSSHNKKSVSGEPEHTEQGSGAQKRPKFQIPPEASLPLEFLRDDE